MSLIVGHFRGLTRFGGRERPSSFWLWVLVVIGAVMICWSGAFVVFAVSLRPGSPPPFAMMPIIMLVLVVAAIVLLAAAVSRRLHDTGRSGWWGIAPGPFLMGGLIMMARLFARVESGELGDQGEGIPPEFMLIFVNNLVYLGALITLIVLCSMPGQPGANRYGPSDDVGAPR